MLLLLLLLLLSLLLLLLLSLFKVKGAEQSANTEKVASTPRPGIEPGPPANAADALPLSYRGWLSSQPERLTITSCSAHCATHSRRSHWQTASHGGPATVELHTAGASINVILIVLRMDGRKECIIQSDQQSGQLLWLGGEPAPIAQR